MLDALLRRRASADEFTPDPLMAVAGIVRRSFPHYAEDHHTTIGRIVHLAQMESLGRTGRPLFEDETRATVRGPQIRRIQQDMASRRPSCDDLRHVAALTMDQMSIIERVCARHAWHRPTMIMTSCEKHGGAFVTTYRSNMAQRYADDGPVIDREAMAAEWRSTHRA